MTAGRVAITGIEDFFGQELALALAEYDDVEHILAIGERKPQISLERMEYIQLDLRHPMLEEVLSSHEIDVVCHLAPGRPGRVDDEQSQRNLLGTMQLVSAAANVGVRKFVFQSTLRAYGARHTNPSFIDESRRVAKPDDDPYDREVYEVERLLAEQVDSRPELGIVILRFAWILGPVSESPMSRFLDRPVAPTLLGFDPHFQLIHERDVVRALAHAVHSVDRGVFNVSPGGVLPLSRLLKRAGKVSLPIPHPLATSGQRALGRAGLDEPLPIPPAFLRYSVVGANERMRTEMKFEPAHTGEEALDAYVRSRHRGAGGPILGLLSILERGASRLSRTLPGRGRPT